MWVRLGYPEEMRLWPSTIAILIFTTTVFGHPPLTHRITAAFDSLSSSNLDTQIDAVELIAKQYSATRNPKILEHLTALIKPGKPQLARVGALLVFHEIGPLTPDSIRLKIKKMALNEADLQIRFHSQSAVRDFAPRNCESEFQTLK